MHIKDVFSSHKIYNNFKNIKATKEHFLVICRPIPSENLCEISWKSNNIQGI